MTIHDTGLYARSFADVYDQWYGTLDDPADLVASLRQVMPAPATVIELGSGTGRLATPLRNAGYRVIAVDVSLEMLGAAPAGPHRVAGDMARLPIAATTADAVIVAYNTLFNLTSVQLQQECFDETRRVLRAGGVFAVETFVAPTAPQTTFGLSSRAHPTDPTATLRILTGPDPLDPDIVVGSHIELGSHTACRPWRLAYQTPDQLDRCAAQADLTLMRRAADWADAAFGDDSGRHVSWYITR